MSIMEIADEAEISRGTFYNYFNDKSDAVEEFCKYYLDKFIDRFKSNFEEDNYDLFKTIRRSYLEVKNIFKNETYLQMVKNLKYLNDLSTIVTLENDISNILIPFEDYLYKNIDKKKLKLKDRLDMSVLIQVIGSIYSSSLIRYARGQDEKEVDKMFERKISIIEKGLMV